MDLKELRKAAGIDMDHSNGRKQQIIEQAEQVIKTVKTEDLTEEQLDELFGAMGDFAKRMVGRGAQAVGQGVQRGAQAAGQAIGNAAGAVKQQYAQSQSTVAIQTAIKALSPLAQKDPSFAKIVAYLNKQLAMVQGQGNQQAGLRVSPNE